MINLEEKKRQREQFLLILYEKSDQDTYKKINYREIAKELNIEEQEAWKIYEYLKSEYLVTARVMGGFINITVEGIKEAERLLSGNNENSFISPSFNVITVEQMHNSQIMQSSPGSEQTFNLSERNLDNLGEFIELFEKRFSELEFKSNDDEMEAIAEIQTIKAQINSPKPKEIVIQESRKTLRNILEGMTGSILATELLKLLLGV